MKNNNNTNCGYGCGGGDKYHHNHQQLLLLLLPSPPPPPQQPPPLPHSGSLHQTLVKIIFVVTGMTFLMMCLLMAPY